MKQSELDAFEERRARSLKTFQLWLWTVIVPVGIILLTVSFSAHSPPRRSPPPFYSCADMTANITVLGGDTVAPLCGQQP